MKRTLGRIVRASCPAFKASCSRRQALAVLAAAPWAAGCTARQENEVTVYCALDREFAAPILSAFERTQQPPVSVRAKFDIESTKTIGLVNRIVAERERPTADLFWNNELLHTLRLQRMDLLQPIGWDLPADWPSELRASDNTWCGFAARARVLLINQELLSDPASWPTRVEDLADPRWQGKCGWARPAFGTTATHAAVWAAQLGDAAARQRIREIRRNARTLSGNKQVAVAVAAGQLAWGLTDTDDAVIERDRNPKLAIVFPDQQPGQVGTLRIPNSVAVLRGAPHPIAAAALANFLVSRGTEERLAMGDSSQIPIHREASVQPRVLPATPVRWMDVDYTSAANAWEELAPWLEEELSRPTDG